MVINHLLNGMILQVFTTPLWVFSTKILSQLKEWTSTKVKEKTPRSADQRSKKAKPVNKKTGLVVEPTHLIPPNVVIIYGFI